MLTHLRAGEVPEFLQVGESVIPLIIKRHARAKRICLRYHPTHHSISLTLPRHTRMSDGLRFLSEKTEWLIQTLEEMPSQKQIKPGVVIPLLGQRVRVRHEARLRGWSLAEDVLTVSGERDQFPEKMLEALRAIAMREIKRVAMRYAAKINKPIARITVRDTRSRWGSCSSTGNLSFSWRLIFAPKEVLHYVIAHEVAHLRHMNHSPAFWALVEQLAPNHDAAREWLRLNGKHLYRFSA